MPVYGWRSCSAVLWRSVAAWILSTRRSNRVALNAEPYFEPLGAVTPAPLAVFLSSIRWLAPSASTRCANRAATSAAAGDTGVFGERTSDALFARRCDADCGVCNEYDDPRRTRLVVELWGVAKLLGSVEGARLIARRGLFVLLSMVLAAGAIVASPERASAAEPSVPGAFVSMSPTRLLDTRVGNGAPQRAVAANSTVALQVAGRSGVPAGVAAVVMNVTVTGPSRDGFVTVYPSGTAMPTASNLNFNGGQTIPNLVTVKVGGDGVVNLTNNSTGTVHLLADVAGYYLPGVPTEPGTFVSLDPARLLDTRTGLGAFSASPVYQYQTASLQVTGRGGVPATGVSAVVVNVTVKASYAAGFITVYPSGSAQPTASNLNFSAQQIIPNLVTVKVGPDGRINLTNNSAYWSDLIVDVAGYYLAGTPTQAGAFVSLDPARLLDTRVGNGAPASPVARYASAGLQVTNRGGVPATGVAAVVANVTVTAPSAPGFMTVYPSGSAMPTASNLNFSSGQTIPNLTTVKVGADGKIALTNNSAGDAHLIADVAGYYLGEPAQPDYAAAALQLTHDLPAISAWEASTKLGTLTVKPAGSMAGYSRDLFPHWRDATNNGWPPIPNSTCDVRQASLYREGTGVNYTSACDILSGSWVDAYTGVTLYAASDVDIDHVVPLADSWRSGAAAWTTAQRTTFANDRLVVVAVDDAANQSKGDKSPDVWKPQNQAAHCLYAKRWIAIKSKYALSITSAESSALSQMLGTCAN
ncbi:HNH endonuclease family protein [Microbacterium saccharophilum]|nr:HNH endonuclease family protein [Microbacterium saccharophilum]